MALSHSEQTVTLPNIVTTQRSHTYISHVISAGNANDVPSVKPPSYEEAMKVKQTESCNELPCTQKHRTNM